jgi:hypothetical protein
MGARIGRDDQDLLAYANQRWQIGHGLAKIDDHHLIDLSQGRKNGFCPLRNQLPSRCRPVVAVAEYMRRRSKIPSDDLGEVNTSRQQVRDARPVDHAADFLDPRPAIRKVGDDDAKCRATATEAVAAAMASQFTATKASRMPPPAADCPRLQAASWAVVALAFGDRRKSAASSTVTTCGIVATSGMRGDACGCAAGGWTGLRIAAGASFAGAGMAGTL